MWYTAPMDEREKAAFARLLNSKNYREICPQALERVFLQSLSRYSSLKEADKAARSALHQLAGAFMTPEQLRAAGECLARKDLDGALRLHASTRERPGWREAYRRIFACTGQPELVLDLACGLNPLCLGELGISALGLDVHGGAVALVNRWAGVMGWDVGCRQADLLSGPDLPSATLCLMMKLLPVLERQRRGAGAALLASAPARWKLVTFPTRTLGGRQVGMAQQYSAWLQAHMPPVHHIASTFEQDGELYFLLEDSHG